MFRMLSNTKDNTVTLFDDKKVTIHGMDVLEEEAFKRQLYLVAYRRCNIRNETEKESQSITWKVNSEEESRVMKLFHEKEDIYLGHMYLSSLKSLQGSNWLHSEIIDAAFKLLENVDANLSSFSFLFIQKECLTSISKDLNRNLTKRTNVLVLPVHEGSHWYGAVAYLQEKIIFVLDS